MSRKLVVFDFDHTILDDNTDTLMVDMVGKANVPQEIKDLQQREGWTAFMQGIFTILYNNGATTDDIKSKVLNCRTVPGMVHLIGELKKREYDAIIISDSNSFFIKIYLDKIGLYETFLRIFTNPAKFENDRLVIQPYHKQTECKLSTINLCKGKVLDEFLLEQKGKNVTYDTVAYIGDGTNDFCPILRLGANDMIFARNRYKLHELVKKAQEGKSFDNSGQSGQHTIKAQVIVWDSGDDILKNIKK